jgi:hypothetical protein
VTSETSEFLINGIPSNNSLIKIFLMKLIGIAADLRVDLVVETMVMLDADVLLLF